MTGIRVLRLASAVAVLAVLFGTAALAQSATVDPAEISPEMRAPEGPEALVLQDRQGVRPPPLGADLFTAAAPAGGGDIIGPDYVLKPGDRMRITLWGMVESDQEVVIDTQGNVLVPGVGPVRVEGLTATEAPAEIERASRRVYSEAVQVYAAPVSAGTTRVVVTGPVEQPGAFAGGSDDPLVVYLQRAGGIDPVRGSYRRVRVVRQGQTIATTDLYDFLREGVSPDVRFRNGDAIVVGEQGPIVSVSGNARAPFTYELESETGLGAEIMEFARPGPGATHAAVVGIRNQEQFTVYLDLEAFSRFILRDGDRVQFETDSRADAIMVRVEGAHDGPSVFSPARGTTVGEVLSQVPIDPDADLESIHLRRESVRRTQQMLLNESLDRLERAVFLAPSRSTGESQARSESMAFVTAYIARAREVEPNGVLALAGQDLNQVRLETGDVIIIPRRSQVVSIAGEVNAPQSILVQQGSDVGDYVRAAGGYTRRADRRDVLVFRQDGQIRSGGRVEGGDRILVSAKADSTLLPFLRDLTQTIFQMAGILVAVDRF